MAGEIFKQAVAEATGRSWDTWVKELQLDIDRTWSHEQIKRYIHERYEISEEWGEWVALFYEQLLGRVPVGVTKDAGVQIGVRRTFAAPKERIWRFLTADEGMSLLLGKVAGLDWKVGEVFESDEGITGKLTVVVPHQKLRMTWKLPEWERPSRLQLYLLTTATGKTTVAVHQEMLEDVYIRGLMKQFWEAKLAQVESLLSG
jgi:uncharacterized protein YndB with AHSA1/START domain